MSQCYKLFTIEESEPKICTAQCLLCDVFWYLFHAHPRPPQRCTHLVDIAHICLLNRDLRAHSTLRTLPYACLCHCFIYCRLWCSDPHCIELWRLFPYSAGPTLLSECRGNTVVCCVGIGLKDLSGFELQCVCVCVCVHLCVHLSNSDMSFASSLWDYICQSLSIFYRKLSSMFSYNIHTTPSVSRTKSVFSFQSPLPDLTFCRR